MPGLAGRAYDASWGRLFAAGYDRMLAATEEAGMRERRHELVGQASGRVLELGAGTGLNLSHYGPGVEELVLTEPFAPMARRLVERVAEFDIEPRIVQARAERLPFEDDHFDTVVATLVLCTVDDVPGTLAEVKRVLRPSGRLLFCEHVRSSDPGLARWQDRLERPWRFVGHGCRCNRDTVAAIGAAGMTVERIEHGAVPKAAPIVRPLAVGTATLGER
jgi:ubiquinone/menaquinone biosynthesis C-methylase UbiE